MKIDEQLESIADKVKIMLRPHLLAGSKFSITISGKHSKVRLTAERIFKNGRIEGQERDVASEV